MKRKNRGTKKSRKVQRKKHSRIAKIHTRNRTRLRRKKFGVLRKREFRTDPRVARALGLMRREGLSASVAARTERMKLGTFQRLAGKVLYRSAPGKPWKARTSDQLAVMVTIPLAQGPQSVVAKNLAERKLAGAYLTALRMFRAGEDGSEAALKAFEGKTVGGHRLITDTKILIELEEAGQLDFENLYSSFGAKS